MLNLLGVDMFLLDIVRGVVIVLVVLFKGTR